MTTLLTEPTTVARQAPAAKVLEELWTEAAEEQHRLRRQEPAPDSESDAADKQGPRPSRVASLRVRFAHD